MGLKIRGPDCAYLLAAVIDLKLPLIRIMIRSLLFCKLVISCPQFFIIGETIKTPSFGDSSFMSYPGIKKSWKQLRIFIRIKPKNRNGLILFNGQDKNNGYQDFISVVLVNGHVELRYDSGSGSAVIRHYQVVTMGRWNTIYIERNRQYGSLTVNQGNAVKGKSPGRTASLNLGSNLYIGGHKDLTTVQNHVGIARSLHGCIQELEINGENIDLVKHFKSNKGVTNCHTDTSPCQQSPCLNNGTCEILSAVTYKCSCAERYHGKHCETFSKRCGSVDDCLNQGKCIQGKDKSFFCRCPLGFTGKACQQGEILHLYFSAFLLK